MHLTGVRRLSQNEVAVVFLFLVPPNPRGMKSELANPPMTGGRGAREVHLPLKTPRSRTMYFELINQYIFPISGQSVAKN
jgi:hypothetical protein